MYGWWMVANILLTEKYAVLHCTKMFAQLRQKQNRAALLSKFMSYRFCVVWIQKISISPPPHPSRNSNLVPYFLLM